MEERRATGLPGSYGDPAFCGDHGFYPHMNHAAAAVTAERDFQHSFLGASPMSHFAAVATDASHVAAAEGKSSMTIS